MKDMDFVQALQQKLADAEAQRDWAGDEAYAGIMTVAELQTRIYELERRLEKCGIHPHEDLSEADYEDIRRKLDRLEVFGVAGVAICTHCRKKTNCELYLMALSDGEDVFPDYVELCQDCIDAEQAKVGV